MVEGNRLLFTNKSFHSLWIGQSFANLGDVLYIVALMDIIYQATQSATYMALVPLTITFSQFVSGLMAPLLFDRYSLKKILVFSQLAKTLILCGVGFLLFMAVTPLFILYVLVAVSCVAFLDGWALPSRNSLVPRLVSEELLTKANGFLATVDQTIRLSGWAVGGILVALWGGSILLWVVVSLFVLSTLCMVFIQYRDFKKSLERDKKETLKEGWITILQTPILKNISMMNIAEGIASGVWIAAILYVYIEEALRVGEQWWGFINSTFFLGLMLGGVLTFKLSKMLDMHLGATIIYGSLVSCVLTLSFGLTTIPWLALLLSFLFGISSQMKDVAQNTIFQKSCSSQTLPKVYSAQGVVLSLTFGSSTLLLGALTDVFGVRFTFVFSAVLLMLSTIFALWKRADFYTQQTSPMKKVQT